MKSGKTDSCGCALSAKFMVAALAASTAYYGWQFGANDMSIGGMALRVTLVTFAAASVGKIVGILRYRSRGKALFRSVP